MARSKKKKGKKLSPDERRAKFEEQFGDATICWAILNEEFCGKVQLQLEGTCYAHSAVRSLIAVSRACGIALTGSIQELVERLRYVFPCVDDEEVKFSPKKGIANTIENCFRYIIEHGLFLEKDYPLRRTIKGLEDIAIIHPPLKKIKMENYHLIDIDEDCDFYSQVDTKLHQHPLIGTIACMDSGFQAWNTEGVYRETIEQRETIKRLVDNVRKGWPRDDTDPLPLLHSVLIVGYGDGYYIIQNSWGEEWGILGYARISKDCVIEAGWPVNVTLHDDIEKDFWEDEKRRLLSEGST